MRLKQNEISERIKNIIYSEIESYILNERLVRSYYINDIKENIRDMCSIEFRDDKNTLVEFYIDRYFMEYLEDLMQYYEVLPYDSYFIENEGTYILFTNYETLMFSSCHRFELKLNINLELMDNDSRDRLIERFDIHNMNTIKAFEGYDC